MFMFYLVVFTHHIVHTIHFYFFFFIYLTLYGWCVEKCVRRQQSWNKTHVSKRKTNVTWNYVKNKLGNTYKKKTEKQEKDSHNAIQLLRHVRLTFHTLLIDFHQRVKKKGFNVVQYLQTNKNQSMKSSRALTLCDFHIIFIDLRIPNTWIRERETRIIKKMKEK